MAFYSKAFLPLLAALFLVTGAHAAAAQTIIRDTEIEEYMAEWFAPVYKAAGMSPDQVKIILVQDPQINAFVAGGANIFFYTGLLQKTENPGEVIGVMAHELGHITGGHLIRGREAMEQASYESILGMILGVGAAIASGDGEAAPTIGAAGSSMAQRGFLKHSRTFESSADQAALRYLETAQYDPRGLESFLKKLEGQELLASSQQSEYVRSHPLTRSRVDTIRAAAEKSPYSGKG
ncbi:MAG: M48 family metalloprotease, partial [Micavibrio sp.]